jgi:hypothetical protein
METNSINKNIRHWHKCKNEFKKGHQPKGTLDGGHEW